MERLIFLFLVLGLVSCDPNDDTIYAQYQVMDGEVEDDGTYNPYDDTDYVYGGTLNNWSNNDETLNLTGTKWILSKWTLGFITEYPNDTIEFVNKNYYKVNDLAVRTYTISNITGSTNKSLTFNYFYPLNGSGTYTGQVGHFFIEDGVINGGEFHDNQNTSLVYKIWMVKL